MKDKNPATNNEEVIVLGETIKKSDMPEIFRLATSNKAELEKTVRSVMAAQGYTNAGSAMAMLESDLEG